MKPRTIDASFDRLDEVASLVVKIPGYKRLAQELGLKPNYLKNVMSRLVRIRRTGVRVPRETILQSLSNEKQFELLIERLNKRGEVNIERDTDNCQPSGRF